MAPFGRRYRRASGGRPGGHWSAGGQSIIRPVGLRAVRPAEWPDCWPQAAAYRNRLWELVAEYRGRRSERRFAYETILGRLAIRSAGSSRAGSGSSGEAAQSLCGLVGFNLGRRARNWPPTWAGRQTGRPVGPLPPGRPAAGELIYNLAASEPIRPARGHCLAGWQTPGRRPGDISISISPERAPSSVRARPEPPAGRPEINEY